MYEYSTIIRDCSFVGFNYILLFNVLILNNTFRCFDYSKQLYIVKNLVKSGVLGYITLMSFSDVLPQFLNKFDNEIIKNYASLYVSNDIIALIFVERLPLTTKIHHSITTLLLFYTFNIDFNDNKHFGELLVIYTILSSYTFIVNFYLGIRYFRTNEIDNISSCLYNNTINRYIDITRIIASYNYKYICILNWFIHINIILFKLFNNQLYIPYYFYCFLLFFIVNDDLILMSWLSKKSI